MMLAAAVAAKLVILYGGQPPTVINYPTMARCENAKRILLEQAAREIRIESGNLPVGTYSVKAYCIPG